MDIINFILNNTLVYLPRKINEKSFGGIASSSFTFRRIQRTGASPRNMVAKLIPIVIGRKEHPAVGGTVTRTEKEY